MLYEEARQEILDVCRRMVRKGYFLGTWGNVSVRIGDHIVLTPSKVEYGSMRLEDFVVIDLEGNKVEGSRTPTSEKEVHRQIYLVRDDIKAVIHAHTQKPWLYRHCQSRQYPVWWRKCHNCSAAKSLYPGNIFRQSSIRV